MSDVYLDLIETVKNAEIVAKAFNIEPFPIYFLGGSACILGKYSDRATKDIDFVDIGYSAKAGKVFAMFKDYDMLEYESTILSPKYKERAIKLPEFKYFDVFVISKEDIIVSKIIRMAQKDIEDINILINDSDKKIISEIIEEVLQRPDLYESKKQAFANNLPLFKEMYNV